MNWKLPMVSDVLCLHIYDRIFVYLATFFCLAVQQANVRAFYKLLDGVAHADNNSRLFYLGVLPCFALPLVGIFDEHQFGKIHGMCALIYFGGIGIYSFFLARTFNTHKSVYPAEDQSNINTLAWLSWGILGIPALFGISANLYGVSYWTTPFLEWATVLFTINFFIFASFSNPFYDTVHLYVLPSKAKAPLN